jgi:hypothetical protein
MPLRDFVDSHPVPRSRHSRRVSNHARHPCTSHSCSRVISSHALRMTDFPFEPCTASAQRVLARPRSAFRRCSGAGHIPPMPDYRRNRVPGGTFFFTVNLLDRRSDRCATRRRSAGANPRSVSCRCLGRAPRPPPPPPSPASGGEGEGGAARRRRRLPRPLARDRDRVRQVVADRRTAIGGYDQPQRTRYLAAPLLGAHNPRPAGFRPLFRLHPFQSGQARCGRASGGLALLDVSPLRCRRNVSQRLGGRC